MPQRLAPQLRLGTDLVHVPDVQSSVDRFGQRYLQRLYTERELATCAMNNGWSAPRLAARFAAKEAAMKVLRPVDGMSYRDIEVVTDATGAPDIAFTGSARLRADAVGLCGHTLSLSHDGAFAMAVFAAYVE